MANSKYTYAYGRRKTATVTARLFEEKGVDTINGKPIEEVFTSPLQVNRLYKPFEVTDTKGKYHITLKGKGGGVTGQLDAAVLAIARALVKIDPEHRAALKPYDLLTRDDRMVERKKTGKPKARKDRQFSKR